MDVTGGGTRAWFHALLPACCLGCGRALPAGPVPFALCRRCRGRLSETPPPAHRCRCCAAPLAVPGAARQLCGVCRRSPPAFSRLVAPWAYQSPLVEVIRALKFRRLAWLGERLAAPLAGALLAEAGSAADLVVPVPLHWRRRLSRGYNQAATIARPLARRLGVPCAELLERRKATPPQTGLARQGRRDNLRGAFVAPARHRPSLAGRRILLVDDVVTTGATLDTAAAALLAGGAALIVAATVARTPMPAERGAREQSPRSRGPAFVGVRRH